MEKRFSRIIESGTRIAFAVMVLFAAFTFYRVGWAAGVIELAIIALVYVYYRARSRHRSAEIRKYVETLAFSVDDASKASMVSFPLPMVILRLDSGEIIWGNDSFAAASGRHETLFETHITDVLHGFDTRWIMEGKSSVPMTWR